MTDAYQPNDPLLRSEGVSPAADAVIGTPAVPLSGTTGNGQPSGVKDTAKEEASNVGGSAKDAAGRVAGTAKEEAANVGDSAKDAAGRVAGTAKEEVRNVASEAKQQARQLIDTTVQEARDQASTQQRRAAEGMRTIADDLSSMASGNGPTDGIASQIVSEVGNRVESVATWLNDREPADLLQELKTYARRHPVTFIAIAGAAGLLVGRLTRGLITDAQEQKQDTSGPTYGAATTGYATGTTTGYPAGTTTGYTDVTATGYTGTTGYTDTTTTGYAAPTSPRHSADDAAIWAEEPITGTPASDGIYGTRPTEERGL